jgi:hypothetical protein
MKELMEITNENLFLILSALTRMEHKTTGSMTREEYWAVTALAQEIEAPQYITEYFARKAIESNE